ncbi:E3 ubiquitin-protein ligase UPL5 [Hirschfeldia incana]|nr:E3 ubiquitin-protein ligase UPL5 [Hirschfeldia incana]
MTLRRSDSPISHRSDNHKRKLDDYASSDHTPLDLLQRMKRHESDADRVSQKHPLTYYTHDRSLHTPGECSSSSSSSSTRLQLFVRMMSGGKTIVIHADRNDTVEHLHHRIQLKTQIPVTEQRVIYKGRQLQFEHTLNHYSIEQDSSLHLVGRMQSTEYPVACQTVDEIMSTISRMHRGENLYVGRTNINDKLVKFFARIPAESNRSASKYLKIFSNSSVPAALVMLFVSPLEINKACGKSSIKLFLNSCVSLPMHQQNSCLPVVLEFVRLLRGACPDNKLYVSCRNTLGSMLELVYKCDEFQYRLFTIGEEIYPCVSELADLIGKELVENTGPSSSDVQRFSSFWQPLKRAITAQLPCLFPVAMPLRNTVLEAEIGKLYLIFRRLLTVMDTCMYRIESRGGVVNNMEAMSASWSQYLAILKIMDSMCELYQGGKEQVASLLNTRKVSFSALVLKFAKRGDDDHHQWIFDYKEATTFESRRHLAMLLFPDVKEDYDEMHEMLIDRSNLFAESFEYISSATPGSLHSGLFMEFKNEEATGPGVLREWFYLVCQEIFNPRNALFLRSADDFRRFSPNPASKVDPLHLSYFEFTGRVIALALMHKVQVGVLFDRVFFTQLAHPEISLEDIKDTDRVMYNSCKQILEMDPAFFDSNAGLGLTFELETEELGKRETVELLPDGKSIAVNSQNREQYVKLLIKQRFAASISQHVERFSKGFSDILSDAVPAFFNRIYLEDFDGMLRGGENPISVDDWRAHTEYNGFKETDRQIDWFWKIMKKMTEEERRSVLFFWTSTKFIPVEGFRGLSSKLYIYRLHEANDRLPTSHTCFYRLCLPKYPTSALMEQRLRFIAQDHVSSSFGKW